MVDEWDCYFEGKSGVALKVVDLVATKSVISPQYIGFEFDSSNCSAICLVYILDAIDQENAIVQRCILPHRSLNLQYLADPQPTPFTMAEN